MDAPGLGVEVTEAAAGAVARRFFPPGTSFRVERLPHGHIHDTWLIDPDGSAPPGSGLVLQRLNDRVFPDVLQMMGNVLRVAAHLGAPSAVTTPEGAVLAYDADCQPWRAFARVAGASSSDVVTTPKAAGQIGRAFGRFLVEIQRLRGGRLVEPIPGFKDFRQRKEDFEFFVDLDPFSRVDSCRAEIEGVRHYHRLIRQLATAMDAGQLPERIVHNDAKASNVLIDGATGDAVCVIDLDTVAPGTVLFDIGDLLRSTTVTSAEDATDPSAVAVRDDLLEAALTGYLAEAGSLLTSWERDLIPLAGPLMAYESAMRFLADHLAGDSYFRITRPRQNLERARTQLRVLQVLESAGQRVAELVARS